MLLLCPVGPSLHTSKDQENRNLHSAARSNKPAAGQKACLLESNAEAHTYTTDVLCYDRKHGVRIDFDRYKVWRSRQPLSTEGAQQTPNERVTVASNEPQVLLPLPCEETTMTSEPVAPYPTSFSEIVELISTGQPVSGIKEVPDTILKGQATQSKATRRLKPWEQGDRTET